MKKGGSAALDALEARLGHRFADRRLLETALTHPSAPAARGIEYQRLEFLGDQVLGLVVTEALFDAYPAASEGELSRRRAALVRKEACAAVVTALGLGEFIRPRDAAIQTTNVLGDVAEAVIAAIYLDGGIDAARTFVVTNWRDQIARSDTTRRDAKSTLQEWTQGQGRPSPTYAIVGRSGPAHDNLFTVQVTMVGFDPATATGKSRREAEQMAAAAVLRREGVWKASDDR